MTWQGTTGKKLPEVDLMSDNKVLITGATGFIGSSVADIFCENGLNVGCLVRKDSNLRNLVGLPVEFIYGELTHKETLSAALDGFDRVVHIAAFTNNWGDYNKFWEINVKGTLNLLGACLEKGINDIVITSSTSVYGEEDSETVKNEQSPLNSHYHYFADKVFPAKVNFYRDTKAIAKQKAIEFAEKHGLNLTFIEPVWVYGERGGVPFYMYLQAAKSGVSYFPGSNSNKFNVVYARDLARAYLLAYKKKLPGVNSFIIGNSQPEYMDRVFSLFCQEAGYKKPKNMPKGMVYPLAFLLEALYIILNSKKPPLLTRDAVNMLYDNNEYSTAKAEKELGFTNEYSLEEGIKRTVKWYKEHNFF
jgi:nucleoside-diphosphate-sugar epimerase